MSKMLHGGRLASVRDDVAHFTSSIKDDAKLVNAVLAINKAHVIMLMEQKIIKSQDGAKLLMALTKHSNMQLDPTAEDVHMAVEEAVLNETGPEIGGNLHVAKSRNDQVATAIRMELRRELVELIFQVLHMQESLLETANKHVDTVILEYTHLQAAQPVTFAHYLLSFFDALNRDFQRLIEVYKRVNLCPLGAGALATTSFPINRKRTAELLGFSDVLENSIDAVGSRDFILETLSALTLIAVNLSRLAEDLIIWSSSEFGTIELPDEFTSTSSIMPQKKNPEVLEVIRARASGVLGDFVATTAMIKSLPTTYNLDFQEVTPKLWSSINTVYTSLSLFTKLIPNLKVSEGAPDKASAGFVGATELANMLVSQHNVPFRTAHKIVGALVKSLINSKQTLLGATPELLESIAEETAGLKLSVKEKDIVLCTDPRKLVETYKVQGGPSPVEVNRALKQRKKHLEHSKTHVSQLKQSLTSAKNKLESTINSYSQQNSNIKLKNSN